MERTQICPLAKIYPYQKTTQKLLGLQTTPAHRSTRVQEKLRAAEYSLMSVEVSAEEDDALARLQAGAATYRFTMGPNKGKKALALKTVSESEHNSKAGLVESHSGFSLHAGVAMAGNERDKIEKLYWYIARPAVALDRLCLNHQGPKSSTP